MGTPLLTFVKLRLYFTRKANYEH